MRALAFVPAVVLTLVPSTARPGPSATLIVCANENLLADSVTRAVRVELPGTSVVNGQGCDTPAGDVVVALAPEPSGADQIDVSVVWRGGERRSSAVLTWSRDAADEDGRHVAQWLATEMALPEALTDRATDSSAIVPAVIAPSPVAFSLVARAGALAATSEGGAFGGEGALGFTAGSGMVVGYADLLTAPDQGGATSQLAGLDYSRIIWGGAREGLALAAGAQVEHADPIPGEGETVVAPAAWAAGPMIGAEATVRITGWVAAYAALRGELFLGGGAGGAAIPRWAAALSSGLHFGE